MNDLDARVQRIERVLTNQSLLELAQRIDALQADLRTMRGEVELLQNQSEGGKTQSRILYGDLEKRLAALETLGGVGGAGRRRWLARVAPPPAASGGGEQATYDAAFNGAQGRRLPEAIAGFKSFVADLSDEPAREQRAVLARRGATTSTREYPNAITAFQKVTTDWPDSRKAPDALVKIGFTQSALGRNGEARVTLEDVVAALSRHASRAARDGAPEAPACRMQMNQAMTRRRTSSAA